jgi:hypothetical protein
MTVIIIVDVVAVTVAATVAVGGAAVAIIGVVLLYRI